ncbi:hypothetical protein CR513_17514, partial [Mucuna pruriens]
MVDTTLEDEDDEEKENDFLKKENENLKEEKIKELSKVNTSEDKSTTHCINYRKFGHLSYDCKNRLKGPSKPSRTNKKGPNRIWVHKDIIILVSELINTRKKTPIMVPRQWLFASYDKRKIYAQDGLPLEVIKKGKIVGIGETGKHHFSTIDNVLFIEGLKHNLLSISQLCDSEYDVSFNKGECIVKKKNVSINNYQWTWHKKLGHASLRSISNIKKHNLVRGLPSLVYKIDLLCNARQKGKQVRGSFESKNIVSTSGQLELLHIDLFG